MSQGWDPEGHVARERPAQDTGAPPQCLPRSQASRACLPQPAAPVGGAGSHGLWLSPPEPLSLRIPSMAASAYLPWILPRGQESAHPGARLSSSVRATRPAGLFPGCMRHPLTARGHVSPKGSMMLSGQLKKPRTGHITSASVLPTASLWASSCRPWPQTPSRLHREGPREHPWEHPQLS